MRRSFLSPSGAGPEEEGVVHLAGGMAFGKIQRGEVVVVGLDIRAFGDREAHVGEDRGDLVRDLADRVNAPALRRRLPHRQRNVHLFGGKPAGDRPHRAVRLRRAASASATRVFRPLIAGPFDWRSSGLMEPRVFRISDTEPFFPNAETRTASIDCSSGAARISAIREFSRDIHLTHPSRPARPRSARQKPAPALPARVSQIRIPVAWEVAG